jgi:hypothetical protein
VGGVRYLELRSQFDRDHEGRRQQCGYTSRNNLFVGVSRVMCLIETGRVSPAPQLSVRPVKPVHNTAINGLRLAKDLCWKTALGRCGRSRLYNSNNLTAVDVVFESLPCCCWR